MRACHFVKQVSSVFSTGSHLDLPYNDGASLASHLRSELMPNNSLDFDSSRRSVGADSSFIQSCTDSNHGMDYFLGYFPEITLNDTWYHRVVGR